MVKISRRLPTRAEANVNHLLDARTRTEGQVAEFWGSLGGGGGDHTDKTSFSEKPSDKPEGLRGRTPSTLTLHPQSKLQLPVSSCLPEYHHLNSR